jgi:hypothetical protein
MSRTKRSALYLILAGLLAAGFFVLTDPRLGYRQLYDGGDANVIDTWNQAWPGTVFGLAGSAAVLAVGVWLAMRKVR